MGKRPMSRKEIEEQKKREDEAAAAHVSADWQIPILPISPLNTPYPTIYAKTQENQGTHGVAVCRAIRLTQ